MKIRMKKFNFQAHTNDDRFDMTNMTLACKFYYYNYSTSVLIDYL